MKGALGIMRGGRGDIFGDDIPKGPIPMFGMPMFMFIFIFQTGMGGRAGTGIIGFVCIGFIP